jgi:hypothetical protein
MIAAFLLGLAAPAWAAVVRQPYLQLDTPTSITVVWRTDTASDSRVRYGTVQGSLTSTATSASSVTNHIVTITGLAPSTKYYYDAGSTSAVQAGGTAEHYFVTAPTPGSSPSFRAWVVGDSGTGGSDQIAVRDAMLAYTGASRPDLMLHVGDIAYTSGSETEFTDFHFTMYQDILRHTTHWPTLGNHEGSSTTSGQPGTSTGPYYDAYVLPTAAEAGGAASGTEAYYSFNYGNTHFISLNSYQVSRSATGPMATWLQADLAATNAQWIVAFWHHPPYSHGTHNSDTETELREMRENIVPILEAGGVDLVLCGHSHNYERSYLIDGTYSTPTPDFASLEATGHILDDGNGKPTGDGAYQKGAGAASHGGAVYVVAGHGGAATGGTLDHPVMYFSETLHGSCVLDVTASTLTLTNVRASGVVSDSFEIVKGPQSPKVTSTVPSKSAVLTTLPNVQVTFSTGVTGVDASDLSVNGSPATSMTGPSGGSTYTFSGYAAPGNGHVGVVLAAGGIADAANPGLQFTGNVWSYTIDTTPPRVTTETPARGRDVGVLPAITVNFSKAVTGVVAGSLRVNGLTATSLSGISGSAGPYTFTGYPAPATGLVTITMLAGSIQDEQAQPFAGDTWAYVLRPHLLINEYLTSNNSSAQDENGEFDDYVEIYNPSNVAVDMSGMHLTDTLDFPAQYAIPAGITIPAHGHLVFWCDSQPNQGPMHTNFNLARAAEAVGLFDTDENGFAAIDSTSWVNATTDVPVGRFPDGAPGFVNVRATPGAVNSIACTTASQCTALADACNVGVCTSNHCVAQPANEGQACDDGIACRGPDTCTAGVCDGGPSLCTGGQSCNLVTGLCETPLAAPLPVAVGASFKYFKGTTEPPANWSTTAFDDATWLTGASGFGYGADCAAQRGTALADMMNGYPSLYVRHLFRVDNPSSVASMLLTMDYDDGFVAYINGHEVARSNVVGTPPASTQLATADHECSACDGTCHAAESFAIDIGTAQLVAGNNVLAIQGHNLTAGSSDFTLIPTLSATEGQGCAVNPECDDSNPCTDDSCVAGACQHMADDTNTCSDGIACTNDTCSAGACVTTTACPVGRTCNLGNGTCEATPVTVTFQQGVGGYVGTVDTFVNSNAAQQSTNNGAVTPLVIDGDPDIEQGLVRFDGIIGSNPGQIPLGATIQSATLTVNVTNPSVNGMALHRMLQSWSGASTWSSLTAGITANDVEAATAVDASTTFNGTVPALLAVPVTSGVAAWSTGATNLGWAFLPLGTDSIQFDSADVATASLRPKLSVTYTFSPPCSSDADCSDNNVCNGIETCVATVCQAGTALSCSDANICTTDSCNPISGCTFTNNANPCSDGNACTANDTCAGGVCVAGAATNCDDANVCTNDSCNTLTGCVHANNTAPCNDGSLCTSADVCSGGACTGTATICPVGSSCNPGTGLCSSAPTTTSFQDGVAGYASTQDTYLAQAAPTTVEGTLDNWRWDLENPAPSAEFGLIRFDAIVGSGAGQIPAGSTISSASLTLEVSNGSVTPEGSINESTTDWAESTATWNNFGGDAGVQADEYLSSPQYLAPIATGSVSVSVTASVQAWVNGTRSNFGWVFRPNSIDGVQVDSAEFATVSARPKLTVVYTPPAAGCTTNAQCDDANPCNGAETCVGNVCQAGTALNCDDANACTTDSCVPASGCTHVALNCDDGNVCTNDACVPATGCTHTNNTASCSDGNLCTTADVCAGGTCAGTPVSCPVGQTCNSGTGTCQGGPTTVSFQQGVAGYAGSVDTYIDAALGSQAGVSPIVIDGSPVEQALLRFDGIFGAGAGQIPAGSTVTSATLTLWVGTATNDETTDTVSFYRLLHAWNASDLWNAYGVAPWNAQAGIQNDGVDALAAPAGTATMTALATAYPVDVTTSLQAWSAAPASNFGWAILPPAAGTNGLRLESTESTTASNARRPLLSVTFSAPATGCVTNADCNDNNACNGIETCVTGTCVAGTALNCDDGNVCTTDSCVPASGCAHANNTVSCTDGNACTTADTCAGGVCVGGAAPNCDDSNPCTNDSCVPASGCAHANNTAACSDGNLCTTGDVCAGGTCSGAPVSCPVGETCSPATGSCVTNTAPPLPIVVGDNWRYFKGTAEPAPPPSPPTWAAIGFDDSTWLNGPSGFGYGPDCTAQRGTTLGDMLSPPATPGYMSIYVRRAFSVSNPAAVTSLLVGLDYDDSAVVYINGVEVARTASMGGTVGTPTAFSTAAAAGHECSVCDTPPCNPAQSFPITLGAGGSPLVAGTNVIAIHAHNQTHASSDFTLIPTVTATFAQCSVNADCGDGVACTTDTCQGGTCQHTSNCTGGQTCNLGTGLCEAGAVTVSFQQGIGSYTGTVDTFVDNNAAQQSTNNSAVTPLVIDGDPDIEQALVRFDGLFGLGAGQIPLGSVIQSATLTVNVTNPSANGMALHRMLQPWSASSTWSSLTGGVTADGVEAVVAADASTTFNGTVPALFDVSVTSSLAAWSAGATNQGWAFLPLGTDSIQFDSADVATASLRPKLTVVYLPSCSTNAQCDDGNVCNGAETCVAGACQPGTALNCDDANVCTTDSCVPASGCAHANNSAACNDGLSCTTGDTCAGGSCVGVQLPCDDGVVCTADVCVEGSGCQHISSCPGGGSCNVTTGACTAARMECSPSTIPAGSGSTAALTVVLRNLGGLAPVRGYQTEISIARTSGAGTVSVACPGGVTIDDARSDYLYFNSSSDSPATNCTLRRAASALLSGGVTVGPSPAYLSSYTLTTSPDATAGSTFTISLDAAPGSSLVATNGQPLAVDLGTACTLTIAGCTTAADCDDGNPCTVDACNLSLGCQHTPGNAGTVCRAAAGACDAAETCNGTSAVCPADGQQPNGTSCSDGNACTVGDACQGGVCLPGAPTTCNDNNACTDDACNPLTGLCTFTNDNTNTCTDGDVCTTDTCSGGACVHAPSGLCGVSGTVRYYRDDSGSGLEPSTKPVPNVGIDRTGDAVADATTGANGTYAFGSLSGNVTLTTVAKLGSPRASDHNGAVSSFDASVVARGAALLVTLTPNQHIAADVTGDGTVSAFDASFVARFAAGLIDHFGVATSTGSDWKFLRCDAYAFPGDPGCGTPAYAFTPISQAETGKDFHAILYGDVTGNWQPVAALASLAEKDSALIDKNESMATIRPEAVPAGAGVVRSPAAPPAEVSIDRLTPALRPGEQRSLTVRLDNADGILGIDFNLRYDPSRIRIVGVQPAGIAAGWGLAHSDRSGGVHRITTYGMAALTGSGTAMIVTVEGIGEAGAAMPMQIEGIANEGAIPLRPGRGVPKAQDGGVLSGDR